MTKKKKQLFDDIMDVSKLTIGTGLAVHVSSSFVDKLPGGNGKTLLQPMAHNVGGMLGVIPMVASTKTVLKALEELDI